MNFLCRRGFFARKCQGGSVIYRQEFRRLRAASDFARGGKVTKTPPGTAPEEHRSGAPSRLPYPLCRYATSSLPLLAYGHFPLIGGIGPLIRGVVLPYRLQEKIPSLGRGAPWGSRQNCAGSVGSAKAGAAVETLHLQFLQTQGPVARGEWRNATQILRAGNFLPGSRDNSRTGVRGKQSYGPRRSEAEP